jgi:hypothetical protein
MKKRALLFFPIILSLIIILPLVLAADGEGNEIDNAYDCLKTQLGPNCGNTNSVEQLSFSLLAMGYDQTTQLACKNALISKKSNNNSNNWGNDDIKLTAQAILALNHISEDVSVYVNWLESKRKLTEDLNWFLQIDADNATECQIRRDNGSEKDFNIRENKIVTGSSSCLDPASSEQNYYYEIDEDCLDSTFTISCDENFVTSVFYKKPGSQVYYISSESHSSTSGGETQEKVSSYCFARSSSADCDYEDSLWATLTLAEIGEDSTPYLPYISAEADENENKKYLPSAFLYMFTDDDDYYADLVDEQKSSSYWEESSNQKFYDTALALLSLQTTSSDAKEDAINYLFEEQDSSGCWGSNNLLETSFLLYAIEPKSPYIGSGTVSDCANSGFFCISSGSCISSDTYDGYYCPRIGDSCCAQGLDLESCSEKNGIICNSEQRCSETEVIASGTNYCCPGSCNAIEEENNCEANGYICRSDCSDSQEERPSYSADCGYTEKCCAQKPPKPGSGWLIILLIILIILVVLAIIFRNQLKIWFFKVKSKFKSGKGPKKSRRPPTPPPSGIPQFNRRPRQIIPRQSTRRRPTRRMPTKQRKSEDGAFEETMKKLRDMTK